MNAYILATAKNNISNNNNNNNNNNTHTHFIINIIM